MADENASDAPPRFKVAVQDRFGNYAKTVFEGLEKDARKYIENNFPRIHAEPGTHYDNGPEPQAVLVHPGDGKTQSVFHGPETGWVDPDTTTAPAVDDTEKESEVIPSV